jgi:hypothetical protein
MKWYAGVQCQLREGSGRFGFDELRLIALSGDRFTEGAPKQRWLEANVSTRNTVITAARVIEPGAGHFMGALHRM